MTDYTDEEMRAIILRSLEENAARMAAKYGIPRRSKSEGERPAEAARKLSLADASK